jgi:hypothetical protein
MSGIEFCGVCVGGPWAGQVLESDVRSHRMAAGPRPQPLSAGATLTIKPRHGAYVWSHPNIWTWHS